MVNQDSKKRKWEGEGLITWCCDARFAAFFLIIVIVNNNNKWINFSHRFTCKFPMPLWHMNNFSHWGNLCQTVCATSTVKCKFMSLPRVSKFYHNYFIHLQDFAKLNTTLYTKGVAYFSSSCMAACTIMSRRQFIIIIFYYVRIKQN